MSIQCSMQLTCADLSARSATFEEDAPKNHLNDVGQELFERISRELGIHYDLVIAIGTWLNGGRSKPSAT
jgi:hypothetical protein